MEVRSVLADGKNVKFVNKQAGFHWNNTTTTDPKGNITIKIYDKMDRVISVDDGAGITQFKYYENGSRKSVNYPDCSNESYVYDKTDKIEHW